MTALIVSLLVAVVAFLGGYQFADGRAAKAALIAAEAAKEQYHAKEIEFSVVAARLEESQAANRRAAAGASKQVAAVGNRAIYMRDCFDADGVRIANEALRGTTSTGVADKKMPASDTP